MARTNKYTSLNFNEIYEKKFTNTTTSAKPSSTSSLTNNANAKTIISNSRIQGHMLVLTRPTPKPVPIPIPQKQVSQEKQTFSSTPPDQARSEPESISLRPQGRTGSAPALISSPLASAGGPISPSTSPLKTDKFVPPHLRPGFVGREEKPRSEFVKGGGPGGKGAVSGREYFGSSPNRYGEDGRPKSGGGYERMRRGGGGFVGGVVDPADFMNRPGSSGARPSTSG